MADDFDPSEYAAFKAQAAPAPSSAATDFDPSEFAAFKAKQAGESPSAASTAADVAKSAGIGLAKGGIGIAGAAGDARSLLSAAADYIGKELGASPESIQAFKDKAYNAAQYVPGGVVVSNAPTSAQIQKGMEGVTGDFYKPQTTAGEYAQTIGEFAPAAVGGEEAMIPRLINRVVAPALASETAGQMAKGTAAEPYARVVAGILGGLRGGGSAATVAPMTAEDAIKAGSQAYESPIVKNVLIDPSHVQGISDSIMSDLDKARFNDRIAPQTRAVVSDLATPIGGALHSMEDYQTTRELLSKIAGNFNNPLEQAAASKAITSLDKQFSNIPQTAAVSGDMGAANSTITEGRANYAAGKAAQRIQDKIDNAELQAASAHSGGNIDNATRQKLRTVLTSQKQSRGLSPDELDQIDQVVRGSPTGNALRAVGSILGGKGGLATMLSAAEGMHVLGPIGAAAPAAGYGIKKLGDVLTQRAANNAVQQILSRAPAAGAATQNAASGMGAQGASALARAIVAGEAAGIPRLYVSPNPAGAAQQQNPVAQ